MMSNAIFGKLIFNTGWKTKTSIPLYGRSYEITVKAKAYFEKDGVTAEQESAFGDFCNNKKVRLETIEKLLNEFSNENTGKRFTPQTLLFERDGRYALLLDDKEDEDGGVAICLVPTPKLISQDEYL
jgi:hypothetical protein